MEGELSKTEPNKESEKLLDDAALLKYRYLPSEMEEIGEASCEASDTTNSIIARVKSRRKNAEKRQLTTTRDRKSVV